MHWRQAVRIASAALLLLALAPFPYAYYQLLRFFVAGVAAHEAYLSFVERRRAWCWTWIAIAIVFNPLVPIHFGRTIWNAVDVAAAVVFAFAGVPRWRRP